MLTFPILWELGFSAFQVLVGVGILWMLFVEPHIPSRALSVTVMILVAVSAAAFRFYSGLRKIRTRWLAAQERIQASESAAVEYEGEIE